MSLSSEEVEYIATLAKLGLTKEEIEMYRLQLADILSNFQLLSEVNTTDIPPTGGWMMLENVMREDIPSKSFSKEDILGNAPSREGDYFRTPHVLE